MKRFSKGLSVVVWVMLMGGSASAQRGAVSGVSGMSSADDSEPSQFLGDVADQLFSPELVMRSQQELNLTDSQRNAVISEAQKVEANLVKLRWELASVTEQLASELNASKVDEGKVISRADKVISAEREVKLAKLRMLVRIKNVLTEEQRKKLAEKREKDPFSGSRRLSRMIRIDTRQIEEQARQATADAMNAMEKSMSIVEVDSMPEGFDIKLDGLSKGKAPIQFQVFPGDHAIEATNPASKKSQTKKLRVSKGERLKLKFAEP